MVDKNTGKPLEENEEGKEIFTCPKCLKMHKVSVYVYAQMLADILIHTCSCGFKTKFYADEMYQNIKGE